VLTNVVISAAALSVYFFLGDEGPSSMRTVWVLGLGTTAGIAAMAVALLPAVRRSGTELKWRFQPRHPAIRSVVRLSGWTVGFAVANQIALIIVLTLARGVGVGAVSAYQYAFIFFQLPYGLIAVSLMTAVLPELATAARNQDHQMFAERFHEGLGLLLTFMLPAAGAYLFIGGRSSRCCSSAASSARRRRRRPPRCSPASASAFRRSPSSCTACGPSTHGATPARPST
jgi:putative peptidoglycan lipid II flippase